MDIGRFKALPVMGILRGIRPGSIEPLAESILASGLETVEIAMNTDGASSLISQLRKASGSRLMVGAGTVLNIESLKSALDSGATFIVMPTLIEDVMEYCVKNVIPVFPGALTPSEIYEAWSAGATMVKVFPAGVMGGPDYFKEVKAPFNKVELLACGGVRPDNIGEYFSSGASAVAFGASIFKKELMDKHDYPQITKLIRQIVSEVRGAQ